MSALYTFADLYNQVLAYLDETGTTGTSLTLAKNLLNQAHQMRLAMQAWPFMIWDTPETFTCTTGTRFYPLHQEFWRPLYFFNRATSAYLIEVPIRQLADTQARWNDQTGHPSNFRLGSRSSVVLQPSVSTQLKLVSSSASDNSAAKAVTIRGVTANGVTSESLTPSGTAPVTSTNSYSKILSVTKALAWSGNLTLTNSGSTETYLFLFPSEFGRSYQQIEFLIVPDAADVIEYRFIRQPTALVNDNDVPDIPQPHSQILVWDTLLLFAGYLTDISQKSIDAWKDIQKKMELQLAEAFLEGQSVEAGPKYIRYIDGNDSSVRIFS